MDRLRQNNTKSRASQLLDYFSMRHMFLTGHKKKRTDITGQLLIEMMVAMSVLIIGLLGVFAVLSQSFGLNRVATNQYIAANLAAEGIEVTKNILDANVIANTAWNSGFVFADSGNFGVQYDTKSLDATAESNATKKLRLDSSTGVYNYDTGSETNFIRTINVENISPDEIKIVSKVKWIDRGGLPLEIGVEDHFLNWRANL